MKTNNKDISIGKGAILSIGKENELVSAMVKKRKGKRTNDTRTNTKQH